MPSATIKQISGLNTSPNPFSKVPDGALTAGDEVMIRGSGVLESRRGMAPSAQSFAADRCFPLPNTRKAVTTARAAAAPGVYDPDTDTFVTLTRLCGKQPFAYPYQGDARTSVWGATGNSNQYLAGQQGLAAVGGAASTNWRAAGLPRPAIQLIQLDTSGTHGPSVMATGVRRTYCATLAWYDALGNFYESEPSDPQWIENVGAAATPNLSIFYPPSTPPGAFMRVWRALESATGTVSSAEFFLVREFIDPAQSVDGNTGYVLGQVNNLYDISIDSLLNVPLYTNPQTGDGFGILSSNARPPVAACIAWFKQRMYSGRITFQQQIVLQVIGTGTGGIQLGDVVTLGGLTLTAQLATGGYGSPGYVSTISPLVAGFFCFTGGTTTQNIEGTARSIVAAINGLSSQSMAISTDPKQMLVAYYASSGVNDWGRIVISRPVPAPFADDPSVAFNVVTTSAGVRFPNGSTSSTDNLAPGGLCWSKPNQPEAVPVVNFTNVGDPDKAVLGFSVHRDSMVIYKEDGTFILYDQGGPQPVIQVLDPSVICIAPQGIAVVNNAAFVPTARGVVQVTEQNTASESEAIRTDLQRLQMQNINFDAISFGIGYESERLYILGVPSSASENSCSFQYAYNIQNGTWVRWLIKGATSGMVLPAQNKLLVTYAQPLPDNNVVVGQQPQGVHVERKGGVVSTDYTDLIGSLPAATYAALTTTATPAGVPPAVIALSTLTYGVDMHLQVFEGDLLLFTYVDGIDAKNHAQYARVTSVNKLVVSLDTASITTQDGTVLFSKPPTYYRAIQCHGRFTPITLGEPTYEKQWEHTHYYFDYFDGDWLDITIDSEKQQVRPFSQVAADPKIINTSGTMGATQWLRSCKSVVLRLDPGQAESRAARLGIEFIFAQARANFRLLSASAHAPEWKEASTR